MMTAPEGGRFFRIVQLSRDPPCLGGVPEEGDNVVGDIPSDTYYAKLSRPARLPAATGANTRFTNPEGERLFQKLFAGDFTAWSNENTEHAYLTLSVFRSDDDTPEFTNSNILMNFLLSGTTSLTNRTFLQTGFETLKPLLNQKQLEDLSTRVLHRIYRSQAIHFSDYFREQLYVQLEFRYKGRWTGLLDVAMTFADACFARGYDDMTKRLVTVGERLEAKGRYREAGLVYEDVTNGLMANSLTNRSGCNDGITRKYAGLAYKRAGILRRPNALTLGRSGQI